MVQLGQDHTRQVIQVAFIQIVNQLDDVKARLSAVHEWGMTKTAAALAVEWSSPATADAPAVVVSEAEAQVFLDACASFGNLVPNALAADPKLGAYVAAIRNVAR